MRSAGPALQRGTTKMVALTNALGTRPYQIAVENTWEEALSVASSARVVRIESLSGLTTTAGLLQWMASTAQPTGSGHAIAGPLVPATLTNAATFSEVSTQLPIWVKTPAGGGTPIVAITVHG